MDEVSDDEDFFSSEETMHTPTSDQRTLVDQDIQAEIIGAVSKTTTEEADFSSADLSDGYKTTAKPRCLNHCVNYPYTPGTNQTLKHRRGVIRKRRKMTVNLMIPLWTLRLTPKKMKAEYHWALLRRRVEISTTTHCPAQVQQVKPITSSISKPIHMTIGCF